MSRLDARQSLHCVSDPDDVHGGNLSLFDTSAMDTAADTLSSYDDGWMPSLLGSTTSSSAGSAVPSLSDNFVHKNSGNYNASQQQQQQHHEEEEARSQQQWRLSTTAQSVSAPFVDHCGVTSIAIDADSADSRQAITAVRGRVTARNTSSTTANVINTPTDATVCQAGGKVSHGKPLVKPAVKKPKKSNRKRSVKVHAPTEPWVPTGNTLPPLPTTPALEEAQPPTPPHQAPDHLYPQHPSQQQQHVMPILSSLPPLSQSFAFQRSLTNLPLPPIGSGAKPVVLQGLAISPLTDSGSSNDVTPTPSPCEVKRLCEDGGSSFEKRNGGFVLCGRVRGTVAGGNRHY